MLKEKHFFDTNHFQKSKNSKEKGEAGGGDLFILRTLQITFIALLLV